MPANQEDDIQVMCRVREGDLQAFSLLLARHRPRVENFLCRLFHSREQAEDGAQEVFVRLWMARERYQEKARFTTFLYQIAHNYWIDQLRKRGARPEEVALPDEDEPAVSSAPGPREPQHHLLQRYEQWRIREAISRLPEIHREVFVLARLEERKIVEIAEILGVAEGTVKSRLHTAAKLLRRWLTAEEEEHP